MRGFAFSPSDDAERFEEPLLFCFLRLRLLFHLLSFAGFTHGRRLFLEPCLRTPRARDYINHLSPAVLAAIATDLMAQLFGTAIASGKRWRRKRVVTSSVISMGARRPHSYYHRGALYHPHPWSAMKPFRRTHIPRSTAPKCGTAQIKDRTKRK